MFQVRIRTKLQPSAQKPDTTQAAGVKGSERKTIPAERPLWNEYEKLVEDVQGHALTPELPGSYRQARGGDIRRRDRIRLEEAAARQSLRGQALS
ncbi:MAG TPA: hypothetical protein VNQ79_20525 [Blastocatellia bacterium]|nr:hypothetical protein [Blastocatellia bacterium]